MRAVFFKQSLKIVTEIPSIAEFKNCSKTNTWNLSEFYLKINTYIKHKHKGGLTSESFFSLVTHLKKCAKLPHIVISPDLNLKERALSNFDLLGIHRNTK